MSERKNDACQNKFLWFQFIAELDVKPVKCGLAYEISSWPKTIGLSGETFYRLYLPLSGKFQILHPDDAAQTQFKQLAQCNAQPQTHRQGGCPAQAWSGSEFFRVYELLK